MALIAVAADKGAPGVTTTATALAAVWPRPVVLAECDPAGGDIVYRLPGAHGGRLDPRRGLLSLAVAARHGLEPGQVWQHAQRLRGGLDVLAGVGNAEQGTGIEPLWGPVGDLLARLPGADVIADCGRLGPDGPYYELLARAAIVVLIIRPSLGEVLRLRDRVATVALAVGRRGGHETRIGVLVVADRRGYRRALAEVGRAVGGANSPASLLGGIAYEPKSAQRLRGEWGGRLDRSLLIRTARDAAGQLAGEWLPTALPPGTGPVPGARPADVRRGSGPRPAGAARSAGPARPTGVVRVNGHGLHTGAGAQETRAWAPGAREPAARANGRPAAAAPPEQRTTGWTAAGTAPAAGPRAWDQQHAHHPEADRPRPPWPDPAWPGPAGPAPEVTWPGPAGPGSELTAGRVAAARVAADQLTAAELTAAQVAAARLSPVRAPGSGPLPPGSAQPGRRRGAFRPGTGRGTGRSAGRGRHAGGPARPEPDPGAAEQPGNGRAQPRGW